MLSDSVLKVLSDKKIQLEYKVPIFISNDNHVTMIGMLNIRVRYKIREDELRKLGQSPIYYLIPFKDKYLQRLSQKLNIKKSEILASRKMVFQEKDEYRLFGLYCGFTFNDKNLYREFKISKILE